MTPAVVGPTPAFVLDASVTAAWLLPDERTVASERAYARLRASQIDAHAPELWVWECGNVIANAVKRNRIVIGDAQPMWNLLESVRTRVSLVAFEPKQVGACLALAVEETLSLYDAAYLWLAMSMRLPLLTHDQRLAAAASHQAVDVWRLETMT